MYATIEGNAPRITDNFIDALSYYTMTFYKGKPSDADKSKRNYSEKMDKAILFRYTLSNGYDPEYSIIKDGKGLKLKMSYAEMDWKVLNTYTQLGLGTVRHEFSLTFSEDGHYRLENRAGTLDETKEQFKKSKNYSGIVPPFHTLGDVSLDHEERFMTFNIMAKTPGYDMIVGAVKDALKTIPLTENVKTTDWNGEVDVYVKRLQMSQSGQDSSHQKEIVVEFYDYNKNQKIEDGNVVKFRSGSGKLLASFKASSDVMGRTGFEVEYPGLDKENFKGNVMDYLDICKAILQTLKNTGYGK